MLTRLEQKFPGIVFAIALACCGCGGSIGAPTASSSTTEAKVKGVVTRSGKPLAKAEIRFNPANVHRKTAPMAMATTGPDGRYEVTTLVGENAVSLGGRTVRKNTELQYTAKVLDVQEGENTFDLRLP
jgi:hypothetical protein